MDLILKKMCSICRLKKWLCILFLYSNLMSSERKIASKSKKEKHSNPCHPSIANHDSFLSPPPSKVITLHRPVHKRFWSGENTFNKEDPMPWANLTWPERMGRRHSASHDSAIMNYLKIIPLVFWTSTFLPTNAGEEFSPLQPEGRHCLGCLTRAEVNPQPSSKSRISTCNGICGAHVNAKT